MIKILTFADWFDQNYPDDKLLFDTNIDKIIEVNQNYIFETVMESTS